MKKTAIGDRIRFIRNLRGMTQKQLGMAVGFSEKTADVRIAQYESGTRTPKDKLIAALAFALEVSPKALDLPEIIGEEELMHMIFFLEDLYGFQINDIGGKLCLTLDRPAGTSILEAIILWHREAGKLKNGEITKDEYDEWRYSFRLKI